MFRQPPRRQRETAVACGASTARIHARHRVENDALGGIAAAPTALRGGRTRIIGHHAPSCSAARQAVCKSRHSPRRYVICTAPSSIASASARPIDTWQTGQGVSHRRSGTSSSVRIATSRHQEVDRRCVRGAHRRAIQSSGPGPRLQYQSFRSSQRWRRNRLNALISSSSRCAPVRCSLVPPSGFTSSPADL